MSAAMGCLVCHEPRALSGVACAECLDGVRPLIAITPEQVRLRDPEPPTTAVLVDVWGRALPLRKETVVGRAPEAPGLVILDATISRRHGSLSLRDRVWVVRDFGSFNGTFVEDRRIEGEVQLRDGERVRFGKLPFYFLDGVDAPPMIDTNLLRGFTVRGAVQPEAQPIDIELREPSGGGGGVAVIEGKAVQLTLAQFELVALLYQRAQTDQNGFVQTNELVRVLSLESTEPGEDHIRQLVRRLRRVFFKAGINGLIESRYGAGYRLALFRS
jgi:hypothetical protein